MSVFKKNKTRLLLTSLLLTTHLLNAQNYCKPTWQYDAGGNNISKVDFGTISNESTSQVSGILDYEDFTSLSTTVAKGQAIPIAIKGPSSAFPSDVVVFIDFNQNGSLDDEGEKFYIGRLNPANPFNAFTINNEILIPTTALSGNTRMRILKNTNLAALSNPDAPVSINGACDYYRAGQVEDYTVNIEGNAVVGYCQPTIDYAVEPITFVSFSNIVNTTSEGVNGTPDYEDFTNIIGEVHIGSTYPLIVRGNTVGNFEHDIRVFIDWNQDLTFDMDTEFYTASLQPSTGIDDQQIRLEILIPENAQLGNTRMRIIKDNWNIYEPGQFDACTNADYGQIEDYTININEALAPVPESISIQTLANLPPQINTISGTLQLIARINPSEVNQSVIWTITSGQNVLTVSPQGLLTALANGTAVIRATSVEDQAIFGEIEIKVITSGLSVETLQANTKIYPNPVNEVLNIELPNSFGEITLQIMDQSGRVVLKQQNTDSQNIQINSMSLTKGLYQISIQIEGETLIHKFIKN